MSLEPVASVYDLAVSSVKMPADLVGCIVIIGFFDFPPTSHSDAWTGRAVVMSLTDFSR